MTIHTELVRRTRDHLDKEIEKIREIARFLFKAEAELQTNHCPHTGNRSKGTRLKLPPYPHTCSDFEPCSVCAREILHLQEKCFDCGALIDIDEDGKQTAQENHDPLLNLIEGSKPSK